MATEHRKTRQGGQEIIEFALIAILLIPILLGAVVTGIGLVRSIQAQQVCRDLTSIYIHGGEFSTSPMQQLARKLALGLNLQTGSSFSGNQRDNTGNTGDVLITVSQIEYIGPTTAALCTSVGAGNCTNHDSFVFTERVRFGNASVAGWSGSTLGDPSTTSITADGTISRPVTDAGAKLPGTGQTNMTNLWQRTSNGRSALVDGQVVYVVEMYVQPSGLSLGMYSAGGIYARYFF
jgi:hypothetical protein